MVWVNLQAASVDRRRCHCVSIHTESHNRRRAAIACGPDEGQKWSALFLRTHHRESKEGCFAGPPFLSCFDHVAFLWPDLNYCWHLHGIHVLEFRRVRAAVVLTYKTLPCHYQRPDLSSVIQELDSGSQSRVTVTQRLILCQNTHWRLLYIARQTQIALISTTSVRFGTFQQQVWKQVLE